MNPLKGILTLLDTNADSKKILRLQNRRLQKTLRAAAHTPLYHKKYRDAGVSIDDIKSVSALHKLPIVTRDEIQSNPIEERVSAGIDISGMTPHTTSGSTGRSIQLLISRDNQQINDLLTLRACLRYGLRPWHRKMNTRSLPCKLTKETLFNSLKLFQRRFLVVKNPIEQWVEDFREFDPHCFMGFLSSMRVMAQYLIDNNINDLRPRFLISVGEVLDPMTRARIEQAFSAPLYDVYGSGEGGIIAWECPLCNGMHINTDWVIIEILNNGVPAAPGEEGDVIVTNLHNHTMPFVRYAQGDRATLHDSPARCGSHLPLLKNITGRITDNLIGPDGRQVSPHAILTTLSPTPGLIQWRLIQERKTVLTLEATTEYTIPDETIHELSRKLSALMGGDITLEIKYVDEFNRSAECKFKRVICRINTEREISSSSH